ncbi:uncharacterized protein LOC133321407, partial [Musca vetustissima]|uniref:uncharacterized protein LOC133321407 n=1 Tax=Musca vetustissima TaxID=27455 RepID=UPI002AB70BE6
MTPYQRLFLLILLLNGLATILTARRRFNLELHNITCEKYGPTLEFFDCDFRKIDNNRYLVNAKFNIVRDLDQNAEIQVLAYFTPTNNVLSKAVKLFDLKLKVCEILGKKMSVPLLNQIMNEIRKSGNYPYSCPLKTNYIYSINNYSLTGDMIPAYTPI